LREVGLAVQTLADVYGEAASQEIEDVDWINLAASRNWVVLCEDDRIRRRPAELLALTEGNVRVFCLTNRHLSFADQAAYFVDNRFRIIQRSNKPGPYLYGVYKEKLEKLCPASASLPASAEVAGAPVSGVRTRSGTG
jgi:hypothetical protein